MAASAKIAKVVAYLLLISAALPAVGEGNNDSAENFVTPETNHVIRLQTLRQMNSVWKTLLYVNEHNELEGYFREIIDCSLADLPFTAEYGYGPFPRIQRQVKSGQADGYFPANLTADRIQYSTPSIALMDDQKVLIRIHDQRPNHKLRVAAMRGATQELAIAKRISPLVFPINNYRQLLAMLDSGRVDAVVGSQVFFSVTEGYEKLDKRFVTQRLETSAMRAFFNHAFLKKHPQFLSQFNGALKECRQRIKWQAPQILLNQLGPIIQS